MVSRGLFGMKFYPVHGLSMRSETLYLCDIVEMADSIADFICDTSWESFEKDEILKSAVLLKLLTIGEAASHLSSDFRGKHSDIPWRDIIGFRNFSIHTYFSVRWKNVWDTAIIEVPELKEKIICVLHDEYPDTYEKYFKKN